MTWKDGYPCLKDLMAFKEFGHFYLQYYESLEFLTMSSGDLFSGGTSGKEPACQCRRRKMRGMWIRSPGQEDPLKEGMAPHSSTLAWRNPWTEEPDRLQSMGSQSRTRLGS